MITQNLHLIESELTEKYNLVLTAFTLSYNFVYLVT